MVRNGGGHVVFIVGRDGDGNYVCVGGNQSDAVNVRSFPRERLRDFRWPVGPSLPARIGFDSLPSIRSAGRFSVNEA